MREFRIGSLVLISFLLALIVSGRLFFVSIYEHNYYVTKAQEQQNVERDILPRRGDIFAQDASTGRPSLIAKSVECFALSATPKNVEHKEEYAFLLAQISEIKAERILKTLQEDGLYMNPLKHGLTKEEVEQVATKINEIERSFNPNHQNIKVNFDSSQGNIIYFLGGVFFIREFQRVYPEGGILGQTLGFVDDQGKGRYGIESNYDKELKGYSGRLLLERDSVGTLLKQTEAVDWRDGTSYELSIDRNVQYYVEQELAAQIKDSEAQGGSVIVMNPKNGEIIAMASQPSYDPNKFREIASDQINLFDNPAISRVWEPGSIFKPIIMSAALDLDLVKPDTKDDFPATVNVDGHEINTALRKAYGVETMTQVLANSDNVAMVWVAEKIGNQKMYEYIKKYGFGEYTGIDLANEISGNVLELEKWRNINRATMSFGQGIAVTPLQIVTAYSVIANNGRMVRPRIVHAAINQDGIRQEVPTVEGEQVIKPEISKQLRDMMVATVLHAHNRAGTEGYKIGGKTGTAQIPDPQKGGYIEDAYNHSFVGIGPSDDPRFVMLVKIDHPNLKKVGMFAESTAVPLFGRISSFLLNYYQIVPTNR